MTGPAESGNLFVKKVPTTANSALASVKFFSFYFGRSKLVQFFAKIEHNSGKSLYFYNKSNARYLKSTKIALSKSFFNVKIQQFFFI